LGPRGLLAPLLLTLLRMRIDLGLLPLLQMLLAKLP
jgi:hypothetical protein